jgi:hypothetical protein
MERTNTRAAFPFLIGLALLMPPGLLAGNPSASRRTSGVSLAFARYVATLESPNPFAQSEPVAIEIEASLPGLFKQGRVLAFRKTDDSGHSQYLLLQVEGDPTVVHEVIVPYLAIQDHIEDLPTSSIAITPANYRFQYVGEVGTQSSSAYVFRITPKKKRDGLLQGELWIDAVTGIGTVQTGRFVKPLSTFASQIQVVTDTTLVNGIPLERVTHVTIATRVAGRGELSITESRLLGIENGPALPGVQSTVLKSSLAQAIASIE